MTYLFYIRIHPVQFFWANQGRNVLLRDVRTMNGRTDEDHEHNEDI